MRDSRLQLSVQPIGGENKVPSRRNHVFLLYISCYGGRIEIEPTLWPCCASLGPTPSHLVPQPTLR